MNRPEVSIVVATYNEELHIVPCLESVFAAEPFARSFEVLVVDGGSTDRTVERAEAFAAAHPQVRLLQNPQRFAPQAFNVGIRASRGGWIFILGAHSQYDPAYFRLCLETARRTGAANTGGRVIWTARDQSLAGRLAQAIGFSRFGFGASPYRRREVEDGPAATAVFGCFPRATFERYGLFDERLTLNQDWELNQRILQGGGVVWLDPRIRVYYCPRQETRVILRHAWRTGKWVAYMWSMGQHTVTPRHAIPAVFVASLAVPGLNIVSLAAHQGVAVVAAAVEAVRGRDPRVGMALPLLFLGLHSAYGAGTLAGLADLALGRSPVRGKTPPESLPPLPPTDGEVPG